MSRKDPLTPISLEMLLLCVVVMLTLPFDYKFVFVFDNGTSRSREIVSKISKAHRDRTQGCDLSLKY